MESHSVLLLIGRLAGCSQVSNSGAALGDWNLGTLAARLRRLVICGVTIQRNRRGADAAGPQGQGRWLGGRAAGAQCTALLLEQGTGIESSFETFFPICN